MSSQGQLIRMLRRFSERHSEGKVRRLRSLGVVVKVEVQVRCCSDTGHVWRDRMEEAKGEWASF